jgi:hypothetical protein
MICRTAGDVFLEVAEANEAPDGSLNVGMAVGSESPQPA